MPIKKLEIRVVTAKATKDGVVHETTNEYSIQPPSGVDEGRIKNIYRKEADTLQAEFDKDSDSVRVYVVEDNVPVYAGGSN